MESADSTRQEGRSMSTVAEKAARCVVTPAPYLPGFIVTSSSQDGGRSHNVTLDVEGAPTSARCDCTWAIKRPNGAPCSHVLAVLEYARRVMDHPTTLDPSPEFKKWDGGDTEF